MVFQTIGKSLIEFVTLMLESRVDGFTDNDDEKLREDNMNLILRSYGRP